MAKLRKIVMYKILELTNIPAEEYENYAIYFCISGSAANDCIIRTIMGVYEETPEKRTREKEKFLGIKYVKTQNFFGTMLSTNVEHLSTINSAIKIQGDIKVLDVVNKNYRVIEDPERIEKVRLVHFVVANNETGIIYNSLIEKIKQRRDKFQIVCGDTIQCIGKTNLIDYKMFDAFTFTSQKLFGSVGLSGFIHKKELPFFCPTYMLNQLQCEQLVCGIDKILSVKKSLDDFFLSLETFFFEQIEKTCRKHGIDCVICTCEPNMDMINVKNGEFVDTKKMEDETFMMVVYRDSKEY